MKKITLGKVLSFLGIVCISINFLLQGMADAQGEDSNSYLLIIGLVLIGVSVLVDYFGKNKETDTIA